MLLASPLVQAAPWQGLQILDASRIAALLGEFIESWWDDRDGHAEPSIEPLG